LEEDTYDPGHQGPSTPKKTHLYSSDLFKEEILKRSKEETDWLKMDVYKIKFN
jgi:hypothetical protein